MRACCTLFLALLLSASGALAQAQPSGAEGPLALASGSTRVVYWPGYEPVAQRTLAAARTPFRLPGIPAAVRPPANIVLVPSPAVWDSVTGGRTPPWSAGVAIPRTGTIVLPVYATVHTGTDDPAITLRHELAHLALHAYLPEPIPRWFGEGYATWASGGWNQSSAWQLRLAFLLGRAPPLDSLTLGWPRRAGQARLAYLLSASAVSHLATRSGARGLPALLRAWREEGTLDAAIRRVFGMTLGQFEDEWRQVVRRRYGWLLAISQVTVFWAFVALLLVLFSFLRRRRNRERLAEMEAEERMLPPPREDGVDEEFREE